MFSRILNQKRNEFNTVLSRYMIFSFVLMLISPVNMLQAANSDSWIEKIRTDHPRLFFNRETLLQVKERTLNQERAWYDELKKRVDGYPENPTSKSTRDDFAFTKKSDGSYETVRVPRPTEWGQEAAYTAFVYLVSGEKRYLEKTKKMLGASVKAYHECIEKGMAVNWYSTSRVHWLAAYDWIYNELSLQG